MGSSHPDPSPHVARSESELSDLNDPPAAVAPHEGADADGDDAMHDMATSELDDDEDAPGEDDADYDVGTPPPEQADRVEDDRSSSEDSLRPGRRKKKVDEDELMEQNPELYGLRRSVRMPVSLPSSPLTRYQ